MTNAMPVLAAGRKIGTSPVRAAINKFCVWLSNSGYASYDPYDVSGTSYGRLARRLYYAGNPLGTALSAPLVLMEIVCPGLRNLFVKKARYATAEAQLALGFLNLYEADRQLHSEDRQRVFRDGGAPDIWLTKARDLAQDLLAQSIPGYRGYCWGYPFDWQNVNGLMPKGTPHITATPYCYEVFTGLYERTNDESFFKVAGSIADFVLEDLNDTPTGQGAAASSYTPHDHGKVVNASAYRAFVLFDAALRFQNEKCHDKADKNLEFILQSQRADGSWLYAVDNPAESFIDHFHTCFVLKNLFKINRDLQREEVRRAIQKGYEYYRNALFDAYGSPKLFAIAPRTEMVQLEMYNFAETITLGALLANEIPGALEFAEKMAARLIEQYQLPEGYFVTRVYRGGKKHTVPFLRWPQAQLFLALTNLLLATQSSELRN